MHSDSSGHDREAPVGVRGGPLVRAFNLPGADRAAILLMFAYLLSFADRQILVMMIEPLQRDLAINDTQFSLLHGTSFALFYTLVGLFAGGLVDRGKRTRLIAGAISIWSAATALCGLAASYAQLFMSRMLVGAGEAVLSPGAYSLLSDYFEPKSRARAFAIYSIGIYLGTGLAFLAGGQLVSYFDAIPPIAVPFLGAIEGWRLTFLVVGIPGILLAIAIRFLIAEPMRGVMEGALVASEQKGSGTPVSDFKAFTVFLRKNSRAYISHNMGFGLHMMFSYALNVWMPVILLRNYDWPITKVGLVVGVLMIVLGSAGSLSGAMAAKWLRVRGDRSAELTLGAFACVMLLVSLSLHQLFGTLSAALIATAGAIFFSAFPGGLNASALQIVTPPQYRGQAAALYMLIGNLLGLGLGPVLVGLLTDYIFVDKNAVGQSLLLLGAIIAPIGAALLLGGRSHFQMSERQSSLAGGGE